MSLSNYLRLRYFTHFSKPAGERVLYRTIDQHRIRSILELGIGSAQRAVRMIEVAALKTPVQQVSYHGVDLFEARPTSSTFGLTLKTAHQRLQATGARIRLLPGEPLPALSQAANSLRNIDLLVISADQEGESLAHAWYYVPRMLHPRSLVLQADRSEEHFRFLSMAEIETLAVAALRRRVA